MREPTTEELARALGTEIRRARETQGLTRLQVVSRLQDEIGDRTLLSYEHGARNLTVIRLIEISRAIDVDARTILARSLQRTHVDLTRMALVVDLRQVTKDESPTYRPLRQWAQNTLNEHPDGTVELPPEAVRHLALCVGYTHENLAKYFVRFTPDYDDE